MEITRIKQIKPIETGERILATALAFQHNLTFVEHCRGLLSQAIRESEDAGKAEYAKIAATYAFVSQKLRYIRDPKGIELHYSPERLFKRLLAGESILEDCDSFAGMTLSILWALGTRARLILAGYHLPSPSRPPRYQHVFVEAYQPSLAEIPGRWVVVDPSLGERAEEMCRRIVVALRMDPFAKKPAEKKKKGPRRANNSYP